MQSHFVPESPKENCKSSIDYWFFIYKYIFTTYIHNKYIVTYMYKIISNAYILYLKNKNKILIIIISI